MINNIKSKIKNNWIIILFTFVFFIVKWGAIDFDMPYIGNDDEPTVIKTTLSLFQRFDIDRFDWQHANYFYQYFVIKIFLTLRNQFDSTPLKLGDFFYNEPFIFYYIVRL
ncbi:MAG: hypothetical protein KC414_12390, partial [Romboutsia sp.]|nr:hypothetical protein [Romboutsia sp.]